MKATLDPELAAFLGDVPTPPTVPGGGSTAALGSGHATADPLSFLDGIGESKPKGKRKEYPTFPDSDGTAAALAKRSIELAEAEEQRKTNNKLLGEMVFPFWLRHWYGKAETESGVRVLSDQGAVLVVCTKRVTKMTSDQPLTPVRPLLNGREKDLFHHTFDIKIEGDEIPPAAVAGLVTELKALFAKHGAGKALKTERQYKPYPAFFTQRHVLFTPEQNLQINRCCPVVTQVKTKDIV